MLCPVTPLHLKGRRPNLGKALLFLFYNAERRVFNTEAMVGEN